MNLTCVEKVFSAKKGETVRAGEFVVCDVDFFMASDTTAPMSIVAFEQMGAQTVKTPKNMALFIDHASPAPNATVANLHKRMREFARTQGIKLFDVGSGVCHQLVIEHSLVKVGDVCVGADSHTCTYGAVGAFATGMGATDLAGIMKTGKSWFHVPQSIKITFNGELKKQTSPKDVALYLVGKLGSEGCNYLSVEYFGIEKWTLSERMTLCNMAVEMGAKNAFVCTENILGEYMPDSEARYIDEHKINLADIEPSVSAPHTVENICVASKLQDVEIQQAYIGGCTNGKLDDLHIAAQVLNGKKIASGVRLFICPASQSILQNAIADGTYKVLLQAGAVFLQTGCCACVGTFNGIPADGENVISSTNRNFKGRMGNPNANIYLASPATVAASALKGYIAAAEVL